MCVLSWDLSYQSYNEIFRYSYSAGEALGFPILGDKALGGRNYWFIMYSYLICESREIGVVNEEISYFLTA